MSDLSELFSRDPAGLTREDLTKMVAAFRAARATFNLTGSAKPKKADKEKVEKISLDDLLS